MKPQSNIVRKIFAVGGLALPPEANAYGLARYSRSKESVSTTFTEMTEKILEGHDSMKKFFDVFYFQYGHASIADLAHVSMAVENISILAAIDLVDEQLWDGQERSTRYQRFSADTIHVPAAVQKNAKLLKMYRTMNEYGMSEYDKHYKELLPAVREANPSPKELPDSVYKGSTRARAFDIARYFLPMGSLTSVGQITSGRTLEKMISRLYSSEYSEVRAVGEDLKAACETPAFNPFTAEITAALKLLAKNVKSGSDAAKKVKRLKQILQATAPLPTLVKYTSPIKYLLDTQKDLKQAAKEYLKIKQVDSSHDVQIFINQDPLVEAVTTLLYSVTHYSYQQIQQQVNSWSRKKQHEVFNLAVRQRGSHDELLRMLDTHSVTFDILMDIGSYRDMHRHRRTVQVAQDYTYEHGYDWHPELEKYGNLYGYQVAMDMLTQSGKKLEQLNHEAGVYAMPIGFKRRALFKMGWNEIDYIGKLRTGSGRHASYWKIALRMVEEANTVCPERASIIPTKSLDQDNLFDR